MQKGGVIQYEPEVPYFKLFFFKNISHPVIPSVC